MPPRRLDPHEQALWRKVADTVRPLAGRVVPALASPSQGPHPTAPGNLAARPRSGAPAARPPASPAAGAGRVQVANTLDAGWDRRLRRGVIDPDMTVDLHGHTLATAHAALDHALARAVANGTRVILLVTGKPPRESADGRRRGLIRAGIHDWLAGSRFASRIAAVRGAHPRHGGAGALYVILRRERT